MCITKTLRISREEIIASSVEGEDNDDEATAMKIARRSVAWCSAAVGILECLATIEVTSSYSGVSVIMTVIFRLAC